MADVAKRAECELKCAARGGSFSDAEHLKNTLVEHHQKRRQIRVVRECCTGLGFTARNWHAYQCSGTCNRTLPNSAFPVRADHVARAAKGGVLTCKACR
eukprot:3362378-Pyramimonas_sp.AAC.1